MTGDNDGLAPFWMPFTANRALVRAAGDVIALSPPLIVERSQIDEMFGVLSELVDRIA